MGSSVGWVLLHAWRGSAVAAEPGQSQSGCEAKALFSGLVLHRGRRASYGRRGNRFPRRYSRTERNSFPLLRSSVRGPLSLALFAVDLIVAVAVKQHQVGIAIVQPIPIPVMHFNHVLCREV